MMMRLTGGILAATILSLTLAVPALADGETIPDIEPPYGTIDSTFDPVDGPAVKMSKPGEAWLIGVLDGNANDHNTEAIRKNFDF